MVKCAIGHEREVAFCLMQKCMDVQSQGIKQPIKSVITLDYLTNYIYIEADKEAHVKEACKGMRHIYSNTKPMLVPIKEMTDVLSVKSKSVELSNDTWVRVKLGTYKDLDVDNVRQRVTIKLIPRIDLKALANKLEGNEVGKKKKNFVPPPRYMHIPVERRRDSITGEYFETIDGMMFKDGYLDKTVSMKSISSQNIQPSFDELEKFRKPGKDSDGDMASLSTVFAYRTEGHFMKGDAVIVVRGDLKNLMGWVEKVEEESVYIRSNIPGFKETLAVNEKELCKYFKPGDYVKVVSGAQEGATSMVVKVEGHVIIISSDTTKEDVSNFAIFNSSCGVIIRVESDAFQVLKGVPERAEVVWVKSREIKKKIKQKRSTQDRYGSTVSLKDVKQGPMKHIYKGIMFIRDRHHLENFGFICVEAQSFVAIAGSCRSKNFHTRQSLGKEIQGFGLPSKLNVPDAKTKDRAKKTQHGFLGKLQRYALVGIGNTIKIRVGPFKGYRSRVVDVDGSTVRVELE
ncbi:hypothetical protein AMTRI_Chr13g117530 [Amborella trichopoda]